MKICLILQRRFAFLSHDLVILLNQKYGVENFCGYVFQRSSYDFLRSQREINYHSLVLDEDVHARYKTETIDLDYLERLKQELGIPNLWPYIAIDRILMSGQLLREYPYDSPRYTHEEMMKIFQVKAKTVIEFLDKERPDALIVPNIGTTAAFLLYRLAQKRGIKILYISVAPPIRDRFIMSETYAEFTGVEKTFHENRKNSQKNEFREEARKFLHEFRSDPRSYHKEAGPVRQPSGGLKRFNYLLPKNIFRSFSWFIHLIYEHFTTDYRYDYSYIHPWNYLGDRVKRKIRNMIGANDLYDTFDPHEDFAFFPLHYEPEISLLLLAPFATDQLYLVRQIAKSLPLHFKLYVKEHPVMVPYRPRSYYKKLKKIPNVKLISPALSGLEVIRHAKLITTITGTSALEGVLLKKPAISFGDQFYNILSMVKRCGEIERLPYVIKEQLENFTYNEDELLDFLAAILEDSATIDLQYLWEHEPDETRKKEALEPLADLTARKLGLLKL